MEKEEKKTKNEVSVTRRAAIKAGWAIPVILSIGLSAGDVFAKASNSGNKKPKKNKKPK